MEHIYQRVTMAAMSTIDSKRHSDEIIRTIEEEDQIALEGTGETDDGTEYKNDS